MSDEKRPLILLEAGEGVEDQDSILSMESITQNNQLSNTAGTKIRASPFLLRRFYGHWLINYI
jgi:hypothetical protein